jgi:hypothetical protein
VPQVREILQNTSVMRRLPAGFPVLVGVGLLLTLRPVHGNLHQNSGDVLWPGVAISDRDRAKLKAGNTVVHVDAAADGFLSVTAVMRVDATPERVLAWTSSVEVLQKGKYVPEIGRFSAVPRVADLKSLVIGDDDLEDLASCRPGDCGVKLSAREMADFGATQTRDGLDARFRALLVQRASDYLAGGDASGLPYDDHSESVLPGRISATLLQRPPLFPPRLEGFANYVQNYPGVTFAPVRHSFLYWSREHLGMKPIISITHFSGARFDEPGQPEIVVVAKQVYASHYLNAAITITALVKQGDTRYLVYLNRSHVDAFGGFFGSMVRRVVERRVKGEAPALLQGLRQRLESGDPPA